jgi:hypothetical protein
MAIFNRVEPVFTEEDGTTVPLTAPMLARHLVANEGLEALRGPGVPTGGAAGEVLAKASATDLDTAWTGLPADGDAADPTMRRLGTGASDAAAGDDARLSDARAPRGAAGGVLSGTYPNPGFATDPLARANHSGTQTAATISDFDTQVRRSRLDQMTAPAAAVAMGAQRVTGVANPAAAQDAATAATALGVIAHGAVAGTARPSGYTVVVWVGSVDPTLKVRGDIWVRT